jgi:hypothetical protein
MSKEFDDIQNVYQAINLEFYLRPKFNTQETRYNTIQKLLVQLQEPLKHVEYRILCDETNNTPELIDDNLMIARVEWKMNKFKNTPIQYTDLVFGL